MLVAFLFQVASQSALLDAAIQQEEARLLAVGVDARPIVPAIDAREDYSEAARWIGTLDPTVDNTDKVMVRLEWVAKKPCARFLGSEHGDKAVHRRNDEILQEIDDWCQMQAHKWAKEHDWDALERLYKFEKRLKSQLLAGGSDVFGRWLPDASPPLGYLIRDDAETRAWLRKKIESFDIGVYRLAQLSKFARHEREAKGVGDAPLFSAGLVDADPPAKKAPKWKDDAENDPLFRKRADLAMLLQLNVAVRQILADPAKQTARMEWGRILWGLLDKEGTSPSAWAADHTDMYWFDYFSTWGWNISLIELDLREARDAGRPLVPTWSKQYCVDPDTGAPIIVEANEKEFTLSSKSESSEWSRANPW